MGEWWSRWGSGVLSGGEGGALGGGGGWCSRWGSGALGGGVVL